MIYAFIAFGLTKFEIRTVLWDGEAHNIGVGWVNTTPGKLKVETIDGDAHSGRSFNRFTCVEAKKYAECGWQWAPWVPEFAGTDISGYDAIEFAFRIVGKNLPGDFVISLRSPGDHHLTERLSLKKIEPKLYDGKWHVARFSLADMYYKQMKFDRKHLINIIFAAWNDKGEFTFDFDDIALIKKG